MYTLLEYEKLTGLASYLEPAPSKEKNSHLFCVLLAFSLFIFVFSCNYTPTANQSRYVVLSPEIAEILASLNVSDRIVGVTQECDYPPVLQDKEIVGNFGKVSLEKVVALKPNIVFTTALEQNAIAFQLEKLRIKTVQMYPHTIPEMLKMITELGDITEQQSTADSLVSYLTQQFSLWEEKVVNMMYKPKVYLEIYGNPIMSADNSSYLGQLLLYAGGVNIFPVLPRDYARVNSEDVVQLNPDIIIIFYPGLSREDIINRKGWRDIRAVRNNRIYTEKDLNSDLFLRAGPRNVEGIQILGSIIGENSH